MFGSPILDLAIGMAFIYLLLSLIASTIQEALAAVVQSRSANLEHGIRSLFSGGELEKGKMFVDEIYKHGLIRGLYQDPHLDKRGTVPPGATAPSPDDSTAALPPAKMPEAVRQPNPVREWLRRRLGITESLLSPKVASDPFLLPAYIPSRTFAITMVDILNPDKLQGDPLIHIEKRLHALCVAAKAVDGTSTNEAAQAILSLLADAKIVRQGEVAADKFRANLENWYNDAMDRVSGWYKRDTQKILIVIGLTLAVVFNVDSIRVGRTLWFDHDARQGLVSAASTYVQKNTPESTGKSAVDPDATLSQRDLTDRMKTTVQAFNDVSAAYLLPVGWRYTGADYKTMLLHPELWNWIHMVEQLLGWIITGFALSFGAPFWFDILNKFMVVRSTVKPREKSQNEVSKS